MTVNPIPELLDSEGFKEQVATLHPAGTDGDNLFVIRSWYGVGLHSTVDASWDYLEDKILKGEVIGIFHTHPPGCSCFSSTDETMQSGFAKAFGRRLLWHGVQAADADFCTLKCMQMVTPGVIMTYDFGRMKSDIQDEVLILPLPPKIDVQHAKGKTKYFCMDVSNE